MTLGGACYIISLLLILSNIELLTLLVTQMILLNIVIKWQTPLRMILQARNKHRSAHSKIAARAETKSCSSIDSHKICCRKHRRVLHLPTHPLEGHLHQHGDQYQSPPGGNGMTFGTLRMMSREKVMLLNIEEPGIHRCLACNLLITEKLCLVLIWCSGPFSSWLYNQRKSCSRLLGWLCCVNNKFSVGNLALTLA